jgi:hypothetical protein
MTLKFAGHCQLHSRDAFRRNWNIISPLIKDTKILGRKCEMTGSATHRDDLSLQETKKDGRRRMISSISVDIHCE